MIEGKKNMDYDDLSEFADYLAEFDAIIGFDSEICAACGLKISDVLSVQQSSSFVEYKQLTNESELINLINKLDSKNIPYKIEKNSDSKDLDFVFYNFSVLIPTDFKDQIEKQMV